MADRRWQVPNAVAVIASGHEDDSLCRDLAAQMPVTERTLRVLAAHPVPSLATWAGGICASLDSRRDQNRLDTLIAAGVTDMPGCSYYGLTDEDPDGEAVFAVIRQDPAEGSVTRWNGAGWDTVEVEPYDMPYVVLDDPDDLAGALDAVGSGGVLLLRPVQPKAFLNRGMVPMMAAGEQAGVYAIVDDLDSSAVTDLIQVKPGPEVFVRHDGDWQPDDGSVLLRLKSVDPPAVVELDEDKVADVLRQVDDWDKAHPAPKTSEEPLGASGAPDGVMVALVPSQTVRNALAVQGGESPEDLHLTLAYLGKTDEVGDPEHLAAAVKTWAAGQAPLQGQVSGTGLFTQGESPVTYASVDCPDLPGLRQSLVDALGEAGIEHKTEHGFTPHITLAYDDVDADPDNHPLQFDDVVLAIGGKRATFPLGAPMVAATLWEEDKHPRGYGGKFSSSNSGSSGQSAQQTRSGTLANYIAQGGSRPAGVEMTAKAKKAADAKAKQAAASGRSRAAKIAHAQKAAERAAKMKQAAADKAKREAERKAKEQARQVKAAKASKARKLKSEFDSRWSAAEEAARQADDQYDIDQAEADLAEQMRRDQADADLRAMLAKPQPYDADPAEVERQINQALQDEQAKRTQWDQDRKTRTAQERIRRMRARRDSRAAKQRERMSLDEQITALTAANVAGPPPHSAMPAHLQNYWTRGKGAAKIRWGTGGDFNRCRRHLAKYVNPAQISGMCANLHRLATGTWPGRNRHH